MHQVKRQPAFLTAVEIAEQVQTWLNSSSGLTRAVEKTVQANLFSRQDIQFQLDVLRQTVTPEALTTWAERSGLQPGHLSRRRALCLHAGNLPLVGIQDLLVCLLTGISYTGKVSRKDPWLLPSLLNDLHSRLPDLNLTWSTDLEDLEGTRADVVLFSGSDRSIPGVEELIRELSLAKTGARRLIRTAKYSMACIDSDDPYSLSMLAESVFRYGGQGCRSVAIVVAPFDLDEIKCEFTDYIETFWLNQPQHKKPEPSLFYRYAYNRAVEHPQAWLDDFLIEQTRRKPDHDHLLTWIHDTPDIVPELEEWLGPELQSIYVPYRQLRIPGLQREVEYLSEAQKPPIDWQPDGVDPVEWLLANISQ